MIKNDKQLAITKRKKAEFEEALGKITNLNDILNQITYDAISSQIEDFDAEIKEYEDFKLNKPNIIVVSIAHLPKALIKARISLGLTQERLADMIGLSWQQIQRYEATDYSTASYLKLMIIADAMGVRFEDTRAKLQSTSIHLKGYSEAFIAEATQKLQDRGSLFATC